MSPKARKALILDAAIKLASSDGLSSLTRFKVAEVAVVAPSLVSHYFGTMESLERAIMRRAVDESLLPIVSQGLAMGSAIARNAPKELKAAAAAHLAA